MVFADGVPRAARYDVRVRTYRWCWLGLIAAITVWSVSPPRAAAQPETPLTRVLQRGDEQLARRQWRAAERSFTRALTLDSTSVLAITGLSRALLPAIDAQAAEPTSQQVRAAGRVLQTLDGATELARAEELQLVEATALVLLQRQREALTVLARAPRIATAVLVPTLDALALLAAERLDLVTAEGSLRLALELEPNTARALRLSEVLLARGDAPRAVTLLFVALRFEGTSLPLHVALARAQLTAGDARGADATLQRVMARCPRQCGLLRARAALESGQVAQAMELARGLLALAPDSTEATAAGAPRAADHRAEAGYVLGLALAREGRRDEAREALQQALQRDPEHRGARQMLQALETPTP